MALKSIFGNIIVILNVLIKLISAGNIIELDTLSGEAVQFQTQTWEFKQDFESKLLPTLRDLNLIVGIFDSTAKKVHSVNIQILASFCSQNLNASNSKLIVENIHDTPISRFLSHEELLGLKFWTKGCGLNEKVVKIDDEMEKFSRLYLKVISSDSEEDQKSKNFTINVSLKALPTFSTSETALNKAAQPSLNHRQFNFTQIPQIQTFIFTISEFDKPLNLSISVSNSNKYSGVIQVFGSICYSNKGILLDEILPETFYKLIDIQPNKLMPANLNCKFNASDSKIYLTLDYFFKKEETNKNDKYSLTGMLVLRDHIDDRFLNDTTAPNVKINGDFFLNNTQIYEKDFIFNAIAMEFELLVRKGLVELWLKRQCNDNLMAENDYYLGKFSSGYYRILPNRTIINDLKKPCDNTLLLLDEEVIPNNKSIKLLIKPIESVSLIWISDILMNFSSIMDINSTILKDVSLVKVKKPSYSGLYIFLLSLIILGLLGVFLAAVYYLWQKQRQIRYENQRLKELNRPTIYDLAVIKKPTTITTPQLKTDSISPKVIKEEQKNYHMARD